MGVGVDAALEVNENIVEDAYQLLREGDSRHINLAEIDVVLKSVNLALEWEAAVLHLLSACNQHWIRETLAGKGRVNTKAAWEILQDCQEDCLVELAYNTRSRVMAQRSPERKHHKTLLHTPTQSIPMVLE